MTVGHLQRVAAYAVLRDTDGGVLLTRDPDHPGKWTLPGGDVGHGEHPADTALRTVAEQTGLDIRASALPRVYADLVPLPVAGTTVHTVRLVYEAEITGGATDLAEFVPPGALGGQPLVPFVAEVLGAGEPTPSPVGQTPRPDAPAVAVGSVVRRQRLAAYGVAYDADRLLVTQLARHTNAPGAWTLPGGGVDHGEHPEVALAREFVEETGLEAAVGDLVGVYSHHFTGRSPRGVLEDFHGLRLVYSVRVSSGSEPRVLDVGGTTAAAAWHPVNRLAELPAVGLVHEVLGR
jgi:8-oxo-dGTP diphosphatase